MTDAGKVMLGTVLVFYAIAAVAAWALLLGTGK